MVFVQGTSSSTAVKRSVNSRARSMTPKRSPTRRELPPVDNSGLGFLGGLSSCGLVLIALVVACLASVMSGKFSAAPWATKEAGLAGRCGVPSGAIDVRLDHALNRLRTDLSRPYYQPFAHGPFLSLLLLPPLLILLLLLLLLLLTSSSHDAFVVEDDHMELNLGLAANFTLCRCVVQV